MREFDPSPGHSFTPLLPMPSRAKLTVAVVERPVPVGKAVFGLGTMPIVKNKGLTRLLVTHNKEGKYKN